MRAQKMDKVIGKVILVVIWYATMITAGVVYDLWACALMLVASCCMGLWWMFDD